MPELRHLRYFLAVADELNFTRAAAREGVSQQVLSVQVGQLEKELGVRLFDRDTRRVALTDAGRALADRARAVQASVDALTEDARLLSGGASGRLRLGHWHSAAFDIVPRLVNETRAAHPEIQVVSVDLPAGELAEAVRRGELDVALARWSRPSGELFFEPVRVQRTGVVLRAEHPLAARAELALEALDGEPLIMPPRDVLPERFDALMARCAAAGFVPHVVEPSLPFDPAFSDTVAGRGAILATESVRDALPGRLRWIALDDDALQETIHLVWSPARSAPVRDAFMAIARRVAADNGWLARC